MTRHHLPMDIKKLLALAKQQQQVLVLVTGVFDVLHQEHFNFLKKAKSAGDVLIVGVETDERVRAIKGQGRPINDEQTRVKNLEKMGPADGVFLLPTDFDQPEDHRALLRRIQPDILAVSSHSPHLAAKRSMVEEIGGQLQVVHQHNPQISSTKIINQIKKRSKS